MSYTSTSPKARSYPGKYDDYNRETRSILIGQHEAIEGARFLFTKPISSSRARDIVITHGINLCSGPANISDYNFSAVLQTRKFMLNGRFDTKGTVLTNGRYNFSPRIGTEMFYQSVGKDQDFYQCEVDYKGDTFGLTSRVAKGSLSLSVLQAITPRLAAGVDVAWQYAQKKSVLSGCVRYDGSEYVLTGEGDSAGNIQTSYTQRLSSKAALCTTLSLNVPGKESTFKIGYDYQLSHARVRGIIDSHGRVGASLEEKITPTSSFHVHGEMNHSSRGSYAFGVGLTIQ